MARTGSMGPCHVEGNCISRENHDFKFALGSQNLIFNYLHVLKLPYIVVVTCLHDRYLKAHHAGEQIRQAPVGGEAGKF